jgi:5-methylcytosine-specific restriction endonuclease McrA
VSKRKKEIFVEIPFGKKTLTVPHKVGHGYIPIKVVPLEHLHTKYSKHKRLRVFHHKGLHCVSCDKVGHYLIIGKDSGGSFHVDLYTKDFELMTIDHIKPKGKGGDSDIKNLNPMCEKCNSKKADKYEDDLEG